MSKILMHIEVRWSGPEWDGYECFDALEVGDYSALIFFADRGHPEANYKIPIGIGVQHLAGSGLGFWAGNPNSRPTEQVRFDIERMISASSQGIPTEYYEQLYLK